MVEAVFWDFGGVLTTSPFEQFSRYERKMGLPEGFLRSVNAASPDTNAWALFETDKITFAEFDRHFEADSGALGHAIPGRDVIALLHMDIRPEMFKALRRCKVRFKTACITNNVQGPGSSGALDPRPEVVEVFSHFDAVIESSKVGLRKPDPAIYRLACEQVGVEPAAVVYLDDLGINLKPARAMGMATIKVGDPHQAIRELEAVGGISLAD